jgi:4-amino-4-deoxy-L-arabinose transferase-like glycosyltransferase
MLALQMHVVAASVCLPGCLLLSLGPVVRRRRLHRWLGRVTAAAVLLALVPSGLYLSWFAKGGLPSTLGFMLSGAIVATAMVQGVRTARARRLVEHRRWVLHVLAQLSVAVTSRAMLFAFDAAAVDEQLAYLVSLWVPVIGSFGLVELLSNRTRPRTRSAPSTRRIHEAPVDARPAPVLSYDLR